ncbi:MAG: amidohydrolase [Eubacteriales bacterium]|nr:amidohydrolase [Eubacteriales bacterium]
MLFKEISFIDQNFGLKKGYDIRISGTKITEISPTRLEPLAAERVIEGRQKLILPAFFNTHSHVPMTLMRGYGENLALLDWLEQKIFPFEELLTVEDVYYGTLLGIAELLASGCCAISDMYFRLPGIIRAVQESGFKANLVNPLAGPNKYQEMRDFKEVEELLKAVREDHTGRLKIDAGIHGEYTSTPAGVESVVSFAKEHDLAIHLHLSESLAEHEACKERHGKTPLRYFYELGVLDCPLLAAHAVYLEDQDYALLRELVASGHEITLMHNPSSNLKLASGFAPLRKWVESGVNICIATDGPASNNNLNLFEEMHLAAILQKAVQKDPTFLTPSEILKMSTRNGAIAQRRENCGLIKPGFAADLTVLDLDQPHFYPQENLLNHLTYSAQASDVIMTLVDGEVLYEKGEFKTIDLERVKAELSKIYQNKLQQIK